MSIPPVLAFDYGERRTGIAAGDPLSGQGGAVTTLHMRGARPDWQRIDSLVREWRPGTLVVGLPLNEDGSESRMSARARRFGDALQHRYQLPLVMVDERLSSVEADRSLRARLEPGRKFTMRMRERRHALAAQLILATFLNRRHAADDGTAHAPDGV